jgi:hypothetical protein
MRERETKKGAIRPKNQGQERITFNETNRQNHKTMVKTLYRKDQNNDKNIKKNNETLRKRKTMTKTQRRIFNVKTKTSSTMRIN